MDRLVKNAVFTIASVTVSVALQRDGGCSQCSQYTVSVMSLTDDTKSKDIFYTKDRLEATTVYNAVVGSYKALAEA